MTAADEHSISDRTPAASCAFLSRESALSLAIQSGFTEAGLVALPHADEARDAKRFDEWVDEGRAGTMHYLKRTDEQGRRVRSRAGLPFPWARSALVCLANYQSPKPRSTDSADPGAGWIARYAWSSRVHSDGVRRPSDYHKVLLRRLKLLQARLHEQYGEFESRAYVDTGPVVERTLATAAGLGWTAKNTCLIHPKIGSYAFLAVLLTALDAEPAQSSLTVPDRCGTCRRCLDACPTQAFVAPGELDARRCIAYLTIERRGAFTPTEQSQVGEWLFGCDVCQDVCPWNEKFATPSRDPELAPQPAISAAAAAPAELLALDDAAFAARYGDTPFARPGAAGMRRNAAAVLEHRAK